MKVHHGREGLPSFAQAVVTTGTFDGVHVGHRKILQRIQELALGCGGESVLVTFDPHPRLVLFPDDNDLRLLSTLDEKLRLLEAMGLDHVVVVPFDRAFSRLTAMQYVKDFLVDQLGVHQLVIGYDHHFGRNREGHIGQLRDFGKSFGFSVEEIPAQDIDDVKVSSTKIRNALLEGDVETAETFLTYPYALEGVVGHGEKKGQGLGYPTANIHVSNPYKLIPARGVYAVRAKTAFGSAYGMMNIGVRPTVSDGNTETLEVHLLDYAGNLYGTHLQVEFVRRLRPEVRFGSAQELQLQLAKDAQETRNLFGL